MEEINKTVFIPARLIRRYTGVCLRFLRFISVRYCDVLYKHNVCATEIYYIINDRIFL